MNCPKCGSDEVYETGKFDETLIEADVCYHDFECMQCECLFVIEYHAVEARIVANNEWELREGI